MQIEETRYVPDLPSPSFSFGPCTYISALYVVALDLLTEFGGTFQCSTLGYWTGRHPC